MSLRFKSIRQHYNEEALKLLIKHPEPSLRQVHEHLCLRDHCPVEHCKFPGGFQQGLQCGHVISVKLLIDKILDVFRSY